MKLAISTHWNAHAHGAGEALIDEILALGVQHAELGYDLTMDLVPGVRKRVADGDIAITSVHNFCPVPIGAPRGHPELFVLADEDPRIRERAVAHTAKTIEFAASVGADIVVVHAGNVHMRQYSRKLAELTARGKRDSRRFERLHAKMLERRDKRVRAHLDGLDRGLEALLPRLEACGVALALEILPTWAAIPTEAEMADIARRFDSPYIRYWYDSGHGRIRERLGLTDSLRWLERLGPVVAGMHVHDVIPPAHDHVMPPQGEIDFQAFAGIIHEQMPVVLEPAPGTPEIEMRAGVEAIRRALTPGIDNAPPRENA